MEKGKILAYFVEIMPISKVLRNYYRHKSHIFEM